MSKLSAHDHEILEFLGKQGSCTPDAIARGCDLTRNWAVAYADRLARRGLARITAATGPVCYELTDQGRQALHPEDGSRATLASGTPVADALAKLDAAEEHEWDRPEDVTVALRELAEAVRASLAAFSEGDVRALAETANDLGGGATYLPPEQERVMHKAQALYGLIPGLPS